MTQPHRPSQYSSSFGSHLRLAFQALIALALLAIAMAPLAAPAVSPEPANADAEVGLIAEEGDEEVEEEEEREEAEEEAEEEFGTTGAAVLPSECLLRSAEPSVVA